MGETIEFSDEHMKKLSVEFVNVYIMTGAYAAAAWATHNTNMYDPEDLQPFIREEFISRGYHFAEWDEGELEEIFKGGE